MFAVIYPSSPAAFAYEEINAPSNDVNLFPFGYFSTPTYDEIKTPASTPLDGGDIRRNLCRRAAALAEMINEIFFCKRRPL
jgi:hypothetical protein